MPAASAALDRYKMRGPECAFANVKIVGRVIGALYDAKFQAVGLRASQVAVLWGLLALESAEIGRLADALVLDQTTVSRAIAALARQGLVASTAAEHDARVRRVAMTPKGRARLAAAMPLWDEAQADIAALIDVDALRKLARTARRAHASIREAA